MLACHAASQRGWGDLRALDSGGPDRCYVACVVLDEAPLIHAYSWVSFQTDCVGDHL